MEPDSVRVVFKNLPCAIKGFVTLGSDYEPIIIINSRLPFEMQRKVYRHEMLHLSSGQFYDEEYVEYE